MKEKQYRIIDDIGRLKKLIDAGNKIIILHGGKPDWCWRYGDYYVFENIASTGHLTEEEFQVFCEKNNILFIAPPNKPKAK
jgi:hypothetical protein